MRKWIRRVPTALLGLSLLVTSGYAADLDSFSIDGTTLTLNGTVEGAKRYDDIAIRLLRPGKTISGASYSPANIKTDFVLVTQVLADADGGYSVAVDMTDEAVEFYPMMVNGRETDIKVFYALPSTKSDILNNEIKPIIAKEKTIAVSELVTKLDIRNDDGSFNEYSVTMAAFNLNDAAFKQVEEAAFAEAVYTILKAETSLTVDNLPTLVKNAAYLELMNEGEGSVEAYEATFGLDSDYIQKGYDRLPDSVKSAFEETYFKGKKNFTLAAFNTAYEKAVRSALVGNFTGWGDVENYMNNFAGDSGVDMSGTTGFGSLNSNQKSTFYTNALQQGAFSDDQAFKTWANTNMGGGSGGGGGGGGGGAGGGTTTKDPGKGEGEVDGGSVVGSTVNNSQPITTPPDTSNAGGFSDLTGYDWATEGIAALSEMGIVNGVGGGKYEPGRNVVREEFLAMLLRAFEVETATAGKTDFEDVDESEWYAPYIAAAVENGIANGISDTGFGIGIDITREDACVLAYRIALAQGMRFEIAENKFADDGQISDYARDAIYAMQQAGIINGKGDNLFCPKDLCTRAEAAKILYALIR